MSIPDYLRRNFETMLRAAADDSLALIECGNVLNGEPRYVVCAVGRDDAGFVITPFGHLAVGDPYTQYRPPDPQDPDSFPSASDIGVSP